MKDIKDYIHLYIGQNAQTPTRHYSADGGKSFKIIGRIMEIDLVINQAGIHFPENDIHDLNQYPFSELKLLLRPLSSLKKEDINLGDFIPEFEVLTQKFTGGYCIDIDSAQDDGYCLTIYPDGSMYCICKDNLENYPYKGGELFAQLLLAGFDLFGLIDSNLAIDSSTITENKQ